MSLVLGVDVGSQSIKAVVDEVRYCPFPGRVVDHPSVLEATADSSRETRT